MTHDQKHGDQYEEIECAAVIERYSKIYHSWGGRGRGLMVERLRFCRVTIIGYVFLFGLTLFVAQPDMICTFSVISQGKKKNHYYKY